MLVSLFTWFFNSDYETDSSKRKNKSVKTPKRKSTESDESSSKRTNATRTKFVNERMLNDSAEIVLNVNSDENSPVTNTDSERENGSPAQNEQRPSTSVDNSDIECNANTSEQSAVDTVLSNPDMFEQMIKKCALFLVRAFQGEQTDEKEKKQQPRRDSGGHDHILESMLNVANDHSMTNRMNALNLL